MQNLTRFLTTSNFDGKYPRNGWRYSKSDKYIIDRDSSRVWRKMSGELWFTNFRDLMVESYPPKLAFLGKPYFSPWRVLYTQIFTGAREWPSFASALLNGDRGPLYNYFQKGQKLA